ncbi:hypothetical protein A2W67_02755 [Candidatus Nomurabacteria bacterium RIFCSPLOWO2_02_40_28]|uniref:Cohesin domain-containing protein n=1 Tax=Candidatus Nomurabacteria bacterium GW2011_GWC2_39_41 TaxID=1618754 RepID=A0A837I1E4_9BACT|nr:MAG: hypothetical protein UT51_C0004G0063 [Candidatus Nomurabacteria bacterium GW2011_GWC2_39_41]KKR38268.1 MAG: hypothetical protein UT73_C0004G0013 [Candidatus Nomurabacteria bacterium GW2011_GWB1_40_11]KKR39846.1 MAG: hypothetical protein UT74_C0005G0063 [Parcubacteria group bacterium GW2011_GWC1_40_11]KKR82888.1 MAG: hypothetical protein UU30_C0019G0005 [Candidatus Nomurabacteria bacterium GW2011_GWA2_40_97]OGI74538.1 MAG: hypothetical protein A2W50_00725 [Candidatus Nomurabacteria bacte
MKRYIFIIFLLYLVFLPKASLASSVFLNPDSGVFSVGNTFSVSVLLDTEGKSVNALQVFLSFPPDKLQVVSPSTGSSVVDVWTVPPKFNNIAGTINLEGGIPGGLIVSKGILTTVTFRVKSVGDALIKFLSGSKIFLNDGLATEDILQSQNIVYQLKLPPPEGPAVVSPTHPNQSAWYSDNNAVLRFTNETSGVESFSYVLNKDPITVPDNIGEGNRQLVSYSNLSDGIHYFHIKALRDGIWSGVTHFAVKIDTSMPADFPIEILPSKRTTSAQPIIQFTTTDAHSGLDHYEIKLEPISTEAIASHPNDINFFVETTSPSIPASLALGSYDVFVRAYDRANNYREVTERIVVTTSIFKFIGDHGIVIKDLFIVPWLLVWFVGILLLLVLIFLAYKVLNWRQIVHAIEKEKKLPEEVKRKLEELKNYRKKYGFKVLVLLFALLSTTLFGGTLHAENPELSPPIISTVSKDISNKDIFYVGGIADITNDAVVIYLQNLLTGETISENVVPNTRGDWFYRHTVFLSPGDYLLWTQGKHGEQLSPPSPQNKMTVKRTAIEFGSNRLSYETIYLFMVVILLLGITGLVIFILFHLYHGRKKHQGFKEEIKKVEESIRIGFAVLQRDIADELIVLHRAKSVETFSDQEREKEAQLLRDLDDISKRIGREVEYIEKIEREEQQP